MRQERQIGAKALGLRRFLSHINGNLICFAYCTIYAGLKKKMKGTKWAVRKNKQQSLFAKLSREWERRNNTMVEIRIRHKDGPDEYKRVRASEVIRHNVQRQVVQRMYAVKKEAKLRLSEKQFNEGFDANGLAAFLEAEDVERDAALTEREREIMESLTSLDPDQATKIDKYDDIDDDSDLYSLEDYNEEDDDGQGGASQVHPNTDFEPQPTSEPFGTDFDFGPRDFDDDERAYDDWNGQEDADYVDSDPEL